MSYLNLICPDCDRRKQVPAVTRKYDFRCCKNWVAEVTQEAGNGNIMLSGAFKVRFRRVRVIHHPKPIPTRGFDYQAVLDDADIDNRGHMAVGHGFTENAAIGDLLEQLGAE